ncbi:MAG: hypothetical protein WB793_10705, partial [Candidatus Dormiibacterota bacterium]
MDDRTQATRTRTAVARPGRRRKAGDGAIIQRGDGRWIGRLRGSDGRVKWYSGKDYAAVESKLREALVLRDAGVALPDNKLTVGAWLEEWLASLPFLTGRGKLRDSTIAYYRQYLGVYVLRTELANKPLGKLTAADLE